MRLSSWAVTIALLVEQATICTGSALTRRTNEAWKPSIEKRIPQTTTNVSLSEPDVEKNVSTSQACQTSMSSMTGVSNEAGFAACYNILDWHPNQGGEFQADLRLFQYSQATGNFQNISMGDITILLNYPNSTAFSVLTAAKPNLETRQEEALPQAIKQFSLIGGFQMQLDSKKLNSTQLMSLLIPEIKLQSNVDGAPVETTLSSSDVVYFVTGEFKNEATAQSISQAANPVMAAAAIEISKGFVLPGTTFGIFPVGLIVTGSWAVLFIIAFGLGTLGRMRHRDIYRKRIAATMHFRK